MNSNGSGIAQITHDFGNNLFPRWSPDRQSITTSTALDLTTFAEDIYTMDADVTNPFNVTI
jgi:Tol biopolymer transport system component